MTTSSTIYDASSMAYRDRFVYDIMFRGLDLNGKDVADLAAGSGHNSLAVRFARSWVPKRSSSI
jgi:hypothetical protein